VPHMCHMALRPSSAARRPDRSGDLPLLMLAGLPEHGQRHDLPIRSTYQVIRRIDGEARVVTPTCLRAV
jgi:hypothetical protein